MDDLLIRCSELGHIMGKGKDSPGLTQRQKETLDKLLEKEKCTEKQEEEKQRLIAKRDYKPEFDLSQDAKTYIRGMVKGLAYGFRKIVKNKYMSKGVIVEDDSINLYNEVHFTRYMKHEGKEQNDYIKGECDILDKDLVIDIKSSWSLETFPVLEDEIQIGVYEWQLRGYMMLYDVNKAELAYCMVDTPDELMDYENNYDIHHVSHIEPELRITKVCFERCPEKEELIKYKVGEARKYASWYSEQISKKYG